MEIFHGGKVFVLVLLGALVNNGRYAMHGDWVLVDVHPLVI